jgi:long-chain acyl-CoA synthetase
VVELAVIEKTYEQYAFSIHKIKEMRFFMKNKHALHEKQEFANVRELVERAAEMYPDRTAYSFRIDPRDKEVKKVSFIELRDDIRALGTELLSRGVSGKNCAVIGKFSYDWVKMYFSLLSAGAVIVPLDRDWLSADLADTVKRADAEFLFIDSDIKEKGDTIVSECSLPAPVYMSAAEGETVESLTELGRAKYAENSKPYHENEIDIMKLALLVFTSGTTGKGKGVMLNQNAVLSDMSDVIQYIDFGKKTVGVLPPHHTYGSSVMLIGHMMIGCEIYISAGLRYVVKELKEQKPEHLILVPLYLETFYRKMLAGIKEKGKEKTVATMMKISRFLLKLGIDIRKKVFASLRDAFGGEVKMIISGGAPINGDIVKFFNGIGISTLNGYGITECAPIIAVNRSKNIVQGSVGNVLDIDNVKIADPNEDGEGEICVKGPNVMLGYYKDEATTADAFDEDGYFRTGDYGKFGERGTLFITGRKKNLIILSNGKNVYPEEIESEFVAIPGVIDVIVYEGQSKRGMEHNAIVAEVYPDKEFIEKNKIEDMKKYLQKYVDDYNRTAVPYKKIGVLKVRDEEFPKNTLRKILRFKLDMSID